ncbi:MAG: S8 family peptidase [Acidimicrobiia bacterium]|nr:S8 family peptidase [Acidimicrobiia bacterium]
MRRRLLVFLSALATVLAVIPAATAGNNSTFAAQAQDRGGAASLTVVGGGITEGATIHVDDELLKTSDRVPIVIKLDEVAVASYEGGVAGFEATTPRLTGDARLDVADLDVQRYKRYLASKHADFAQDLTAAVEGAVVGHSLEMVIGGISAVVPGSSIAKIAKMDGVVAVYADTLNQLQTDTSPGFIGADDAWDALGGQDNAGEGVIVGVIDSGIWPEHPSVSDPDPDGKAYTAPAHWAGSGTGDGCDFGNTAFNADDAPFTCNNKLLGAYDMLATYNAVIGLIPTEFDSARDSNGHGTHTLTTAAGNGNVEATLLGVPRGTVSGIAPRASVVAYKGCGLDGCFSSDTSASVAQAILDGVDVMNYSISGGGSPYSDVVSLAFWDAYNAGILVNPSAGNSGPGADTVAHREPWTLTVGASTTDRHFLSTVVLTADNDDTLEMVGASVTGGIDTDTPVVFPPGGPGDLCLEPFPPGTFSGEIVICQRGAIARVAKSFNVAEGGAGGLLLHNPTAQGLATDNHFIPSVHLENNDGDAMLAFMASHTGVTGTMTDGTASTVQGDKMAAFSSRGGSNQTLGISKPDVTAPGVQILAGHTPLPENQDGGLPGQLFQSIQGTSMSAPHSTGASALVKAAHPDWTPGQIKSALMMTATQEVVKEDGVTAADPFDYGSGRIQPAEAINARVSISETGANFLTHQDDLWNTNYPSLYLPVFQGQTTVARTFENHTSSRQVYEFEIHSPDDLIVRFGTIINGRYRIKKNGQFGVRPDSSMTHHIKVDGRNLDIGETRHAWIVMENKRGGERLVFPITVVRQQGGVSIDKTCAPSSIGIGDYTSCTITAQNNTFDEQTVSIADKLPRELRLDRSSVEGETKIKPNGTIRFKGALEGAVPPAPDVAVDPLASPFGYVSLASLGVGPVGGVTDESITNFSGLPPFEYGGELYDGVGAVSNGYLVVGGGTGADVDFVNTDLPDPTAPNNVLAPFWTDLNPAAGGNLYAAVLNSGPLLWTVIEWESVPNWGDGETNTFQVWLGAAANGGGEDISFTYGLDISDGDSGFLTVGAENGFGTEGGTVYFDGVGAPPAPSFPDGDYEVDVFSVPGAEGGIAEITFMAEGVRLGDWTNYVKMWSSAFQGKAWASASGDVTEGAGG